jgi:hypothetical protein
VDQRRPSPCRKWLDDHEVDHVIVGGLVDEFCVKATAIDAVQEGFRTTLNLHAAAGLAPETADEAIKAMGAAGVHVSEREPRGERAPTRDEAVREAIDALTMEITEADNAKDERLVRFYKQMIVWIREHAEEYPAQFIVSYPSFSFGQVRIAEIPEAQVKIET